jgi:hypothetical protein
VDAIASAVGMEHADKLGEDPPLLSFGDLNLSALHLSDCPSASSP